MSLDFGKLAQKDPRGLLPARLQVAKEVSAFRDRRRVSGGAHTRVVDRLRRHGYEARASSAAMAPLFWSAAMEFMQNGKISTRAHNEFLKYDYNHAECSSLYAGKTPAILGVLVRGWDQWHACSSVIRARTTLLPGHSSNGLERTAGRTRMYSSTSTTLAPANAGKRRCARRASVARRSSCWPRRRLCLRLSAWQRSARPRITARKSSSCCCATCRSTIAGSNPTRNGRLSILRHRRRTTSRSSTIAANAARSASAMGPWRRSRITCSGAGSRPSTSPGRR